MKLGLQLALVLSFSPLTIYCSSSTDTNDDGAAGTNGNEAGGGSAGEVDDTAGTGGSAADDGGTSNGGTGGTQAEGGEGGTGGTSEIGGASDGGTGGVPVETGPVASSGCDTPIPDVEPQVWLTNNITVADLPADQVANYGARQYFVRLPIGYDHSRPYPIVFYGPGCGATGVESTPMMDAVKNDAIHVFLLQKFVQDTSVCFRTGYPSPELPYFVQALDEIQAKYCTDKKRVFVSGYSSGAWLANLLACAVGDRIRGIGTAAGGLRKAIIDGYACTPGTAGLPKIAGVFYSGENDTENRADVVDETGFQYGVTGARDRLINVNGCDPNASEPWQNSFGADFCQIWKTGCEANPVIYCVGPGDGHNNGAGKFHISDIGFWELWSSLPE